MSLNAFKPRKYEDFEIVDASGNKVGEIRVKPSGVLWKPKHSRSWFGVDLDTFAKYMVENGKEQDK
ncbi:MAG: hypothetical protein ACRD52_06620 [Candidatus Acidiferrales bacterium]